MAIQINDMPIGAVNAEPEDGDTPIIAHGAVGATAVSEYMALVADGAGGFIPADSADAPNFAGLAPHKTRMKSGGTEGQYDQYEECGRVVSGVYPARIRKTEAAETEETLEPGSLLELSADADSGAFVALGEGTAIVRLVDRVYFDDTEEASAEVVARVVVP